MEALASLIPLIVLVVLMYALLIRPQRLQMQRLRAFLDDLQVGDEVVAGGVVGTVRALRGPEVEIEVAPGVVVRAVKAALRPHLSGEADRNDGAVEGD